MERHGERVVLLQEINKTKTMALQKTIKVSGKAYLQNNGFLIENIEVEKQTNCYIKVSNVNGNKDNIEFMVSYLNDGIQIKFKAFNFTPFLDGDNFIKQAYLHLKTLPEFADATDC